MDHAISTHESFADRLFFSIQFQQDYSAQCDETPHASLVGPSGRPDDRGEKNTKQTTQHIDTGPGPMHATFLYWVSRYSSVLYSFFLNLSVSRSLSLFWSISLSLFLSLSLSANSYAVSQKM